MGVHVDRIKLRLHGWDPRSCIPLDSAVVALAAKVYVHGYVREGNVHVKPHWRGLGHPGIFDVTPDTEAVHKAVNFKDQRTHGAPLHVDYEALGRSLNAAGVVLTPQTKIKLRLRDQHGSGQGFTKKLSDGPDSYRVVIEVANKPAFKEHHLYIVNNSLTHEFRHIAQHQADAAMQGKYVAENMTVGYGANKYEKEARYYGHLADETGVKDTGPDLPKPLGKSLWALVPG